MHGMETRKYFKINEDAQNRAPNTGSSRTAAPRRRGLPEMALE